MTGRRRKAGKPKAAEARQLHSATFHGQRVAAAQTPRERAVAEWNAARARLKAREKAGQPVDGTWSALADQLSMVAR